MAQRGLSRSRSDRVAELSLGPRDPDFPSRALPVSPAWFGLVWVCPPTCAGSVPS